MLDLTEQLVGLLEALEIDSEKLLNERFKKDSIHLVPDRDTTRANDLRIIPDTQKSKRSHPRFLLENIDCSKPCIETFDIHSIDKDEKIDPGIEHFRISPEAFAFPEEHGGAKCRIIYSSVITAIIIGRIREKEGGCERWQSFPCCEWSDQVAKQKCSQWAEYALNREQRIAAIRQNLQGIAQ